MSKVGPIMVGGAIAHPTVTPEPDMKLSLHPALEHLSSSLIVKGFQDYLLYFYQGR